MRCSQHSTSDKQSANTDSALAKPLAPEDVRCGDYVAVLHLICEIPSYMWCDESFRLPHDELVRIQYIPEDAGQALKVKSVCLPFVFAQDSAGERKTLDMRKCRLARLDRHYAKTAWKADRKTKRKAKASRN